MKKQQAENKSARCQSLKPKAITYFLGAANFHYGYGMYPVGTAISEPSPKGATAIPDVDLFRYHVPPR